MRRAIQRLLAGDRADRTAVDPDIALGVPALAPGMLDRLAAPGLREADLIEPRSQDRGSRRWAFPAGLPDFHAPLPAAARRGRDPPVERRLLPLDYIEGMSPPGTLAAEDDYVIGPRQELLALGAASLAVAFGQGFPVAGGLSQSAVNDKAGARTPLALLFVSVTLATCLLFMTDLLGNLPTVVLAAIVLVAVRGRIDLRLLRHLRQASRLEFRISIVALFAVLLLGILKAVLVAAIASLLMLLARPARPHVAFLGRIPGTRRDSDLERHPDNETLPGIAIFRMESSLLYFNAEHVRHVVWDSLPATPQLRLVICDLSVAPVVDVAGARMLAGLHGDLTKCDSASASSKPDVTDE